MLLRCSVRSTLVLSGGKILSRSDFASHSQSSGSAESQHERAYSLLHTLMFSNQNQPRFRQIPTLPMGTNQSSDPTLLRILDCHLNKWLVS
jgi:hypothetical protein